MWCKQGFRCELLASCLRNEDSSSWRRPRRFVIQTAGFRKSNSYIYPANQPVNMLSSQQIDKFPSLVLLMFKILAKLHNSRLTILLARLENTIELKHSLSFKERF